MLARSDKVCTYVEREQLSMQSCAFCVVLGLCTGLLTRCVQLYDSHHSGNEWCGLLQNSAINTWSGSIEPVQLQAAVAMRRRVAGRAGKLYRHACGMTLDTSRQCKVPIMMIALLCACNCRMLVVCLLCACVCCCKQYTLVCLELPRACDSCQPGPEVRVHGSCRRCFQCPMTWALSCTGW